MANTENELYQQGEEALKQRDYAKAIPLFEQAAEIGCARAELALGKVFYLGAGVSQDFKRAFSHFQRAKETVDNQEEKAEAFYFLAQMLRGGFGVERDLPIAIDFLERSADLGNWKALELLSRMYAQGIDVEADGRKAIVFYERMAEKNLQTKMKLGEMYSKGIGVPVDGDKAVEWYERAAAEGSCEAMKTLGEFYTNGKLVEVDGEKAVAWYEKAAATGDTDAMIVLGKMYGEAKGVKEDRGKALEWFEKALENGNFSAFAPACDLCDDDDEVLAWCRRVAKNKIRRIVWSAILENNVRTNATFQRCEEIIENLNNALAALYEESLDMEDKEALEKYKKTAVEGYEEAITSRIEKLENKGDKKQAETLRQRLLSAIMDAFGIEVPKRRETPLQKMLGAFWYKNPPLLFDIMPGYALYDSRNRLIRSGVQEWIKMQPEV